MQTEHPGKGTFSLLFCGKSFRRQGDLIRHHHFGCVNQSLLLAQDFLWALPIMVLAAVGNFQGSKVCASATFSAVCMLADFPIAAMGVVKS